MFFIICITIGLNPVAQACDICGCGAGNMGIGLLTAYKNNTFRLGYYHSGFTSMPFEGKEVTDRFEQAEMFFGYTLGSTHKVRLMAHMHYGINDRQSYDDSQTQSVKGIGDIRLVANYVLFDSKPVGQWGTFYMETGGGISLPTGQFDPDIHDKNIPENFNIGKGALGYIFQNNAALNINKTGVLWNNQYTYNQKSTSGYRYGSQWNSTLSIYQEIPVAGFKIVPSIGLAYEKVALDQYKNGTDVTGTGGEGLFLPLSLNFKTDNWLLGVSYSKAVTDNYSDGEVNASGRIACQFSYFF